MIEAARQEDDDGWGRYKVENNTILIYDRPRRSAGRREILIGEICFSSGSVTLYRGNMEIIRNEQAMLELRGLGEVKHGQLSSLSDKEIQDILTPPDLIPPNGIYFSRGLQPPEFWIEEE